MPEKTSTHDSNQKTVSCKLINGELVVYVPNAAMQRDIEHAIDEFADENSNLVSEVRTLALKGHALKRFPRSVFRFPMLRILELSNNHIAHVPSSISELRHLRILGLSNNRISQLPESMHKLDNLTVLDVSGNEIPRMPASLRGMEDMGTVFRD